jgi:hypothetical protein
VLEESPDAPTDIATVSDWLLDLEAEMDLLDRTCDGVHYWERVRFGVHRALCQAVGVVGRAHGTTDRSLAGWAALGAKNLLVGNPLVASERDLLVWGHERRKERDGEWWDVYCDPILEGIPEDEYAYLERTHEGEHLRPARTDGIRNVDLVSVLAGGVGRFGPAGWVVDAATDRTVRTVEDRIADAFGVEVDVRASVGRELLSRRVRRPLVDRIVDRVDPALALVVTSYGKETFVAACQARDVPVVELQHGTLSRSHFGYSYPDRPKRAFPDYVFTFGEFWHDAADFPVPDDRLYPVGYPWLEWGVERARSAGGGAGPSTGDGTHGTDRLVVISQGTVGDPLSRFAVALATDGRARDYEVVYKLHPGEYDDWRTRYPWLAAAAGEGDAETEAGDETEAGSAGLRVVGADGPGLYELFAGARALLGVYSTAVYEGLVFGLDAYLADLPGIGYMDALVADGTATLVESPEEMPASLAGDGTGPDRGRFFRPNAVANAREALRAVREREGLDGE